MQNPSGRFSRTTGTPALLASVAADHGAPQLAFAGRFRQVPLTLLYLLLCACVMFACADDGGGEDTGSRKGPGEACVEPSECQAGLFCIAGVCRASEDVGQDMGNGEIGDNCVSTSDCQSGLVCSGLGVCSEAPEDVGDDVEDVTPDTPEDVVEDVVEDTEPDVEIDVPEVDRPDELTGGVSLFETRIETGVVPVLVGNAGAAFVEPSEPEQPFAVVDGCGVFEFSTTPADPAFGYDAGTITVTGGTIPLTLTAAGQVDGSYVYSSGLAEDNEQVYSSGASLTVSAAGGEHVGAFTQALTAPVEHTLSSPSPDDDLATGDATIAWSGAGSGHAVVLNVLPLDNFGNPVNGRSLTCEIEGDPGSFTITEAALNQVRVGSPTALRVAITVIKAENTELVVGPDTLIVNATYAAGIVALIR